MNSDTIFDRGLRYINSKSLMTITHISRLTDECSIVFFDGMKSLYITGGKPFYCRSEFKY